MINTSLRICLTVKSKTRDYTEFFAPTTTYNEPFVLETSTLNYKTHFPIFLASVWSYITSVWTQSEIDVHYVIRLENANAPEAGAGSWVQAKQNFDGQFSQRDIPTSQPIQDTIYQVIEVILSNANYA